MSTPVGGHLIDTGAEEVVEPHEHLANLVARGGASVEVGGEVFERAGVGVGRFLPELCVTSPGVTVQPLPERGDGHDRVGGERPDHRAHLCGSPGVSREAIHLLKGAEQVVVRPGARGDCAVAKIGPVENGWDLVVLVVVVLIPRDDEKAVVGSGPDGVGVEVVAQPIITHLARAVVHVVELVGNDEAHGGELGKVGRELREGAVDGARELVDRQGQNFGDPVGPRVVFAPIVDAGIGGRVWIVVGPVHSASGLDFLRVARESESRSDQFRAEVGRAERIGARGRR